MQRMLGGLLALTFIYLVAYAAAVAGNQGSLESAWIAAIVALAAHSIQGVLRKLALVIPPVRALIDPRSAVEGTWVGRVEKAHGVERPSVALVLIMYSTSENCYYLNIVHVDDDGLICRHLSAKRVEFGMGNRLITFKYSGGMYDRSCSAEHSDEKTFFRSGLGSLEFSKEVKGQYMYALGESVDVNMHGARNRNAFLRRVKQVEIDRILNADPDHMDPDHRDEIGPYKAHDLRRIAKAFREFSREQDEDLASPQREIFKHNDSHHGLH